MIGKLSYVCLLLLVPISTPVVKAQDDPELKAAVAFRPLRPGDKGFDPDETRCEDAGTKWQIQVKFNLPPDSVNKGNFRIIDTNNAKFLDPADAKIAEIVPGTKSNIVLLCVNDDLTQPSEGNKQQYFVQASKVSFGGNVQEKFVNVLSFGDQNAANLKAAVKFEPKEAKNREDSSIYFSGEITRASGTEFNGSVDTKVKIPAYITAKHEVSPLFDLKASTDPDEDPDSMKLGVDWDWILHTSEVSEGQKPNFFERNFDGLIWQNSPKLEAERDFGNTNFTMGSRFLFPTKVWMSGNRVARFFMNPFVGVEVGKNFVSPVKEAEGRGLARILFGSGMNLTFKLREKGILERITLEALFERRLLMREEIGFEKAEDGLRPVFFDTRPRDWADAKLAFKFTPLFDAYIGYEYGELPPSYKLVDHRLKMGLLFKTKLSKK